MQFFARLKMGRSSFVVISLALLVNLISACEYKVTNFTLNVDKSNIKFSVKYQYPDGLSFNITRNNVIIQAGASTDNLGANVKSQLVTNGFTLSGMGRSVTITVSANTADYGEIKVVRGLTRGQMSRDCFTFGSKTYWYGGPQQKTQQYWPINRQKYTDYSYVSKEVDSNAITERYWLNSKGVFLFVEKEAPLFITQSPNAALCLKAEKKSPYNTDISSFDYVLHIGIAADPKKAHMKAVELYLKYPKSLPDTKMVEDPIWSTWAKYKAKINDDVVEKFYDDIKAKEFPVSQLEVDDLWETCYGSLVMDECKFAKLKDLIAKVQLANERVTLWIHPFVNKACEDPWNTGIKNGYFVVNSSGLVDTQWWNSRENEAAYVDFTNPAARKWFTDRLDALKEAYKFDGYKFDAGETSWAPSDPQLSGKKELFPSLLTTEYINTVAKYGALTEVRSAQGNQEQPIFMRMIDKDSSFGYDNGLPTLVTTLLQLNMAGYPFVLPDMIGGNGYDTTGKPSKHLFLRWLEANVFMPSLQFSYLPWDYDDDTTAKSLALVQLHKTWAPTIIEAMTATTTTGTPVNPPIWWIAPEDETALATGDQFLVGEKILVAPIVNELSWRTVYLPAGNWKYQNAGENIVGPTTQNKTVELGTVIFYVKT